MQTLRARPLTERAAFPIDPSCDVHFEAKKAAVLPGRRRRFWRELLAGDDSHKTPEPLNTIHLRKLRQIRMILIRWVPPTDYRDSIAPRGGSEGSRTAPACLARTPQRKIILHMEAPWNDVNFSLHRLLHPPLPRLAQLRPSRLPRSTNTICSAAITF
jgi:hypothetical protein